MTNSVFASKALAILREGTHPDAQLRPGQFHAVEAVVQGSGRALIVQRADISAM
jgi:hypothetical protein